MNMDAITLIKSDHKTVEALFKRAEKLGEGALKEKKQVVQQIIRELAIHAAIEEQVFYPAVRKAIKAAEDDVPEALEEHHIVKWTLSELEGMNPKDERFDAKLTVLMESVRHHVKEEEGDLLPQVAKKMSREALLALGKALESAKKLVPTRPHPRAPDTPPGGIVAGLPAALLDRAKDFVQGVAKRAQQESKKRGSANGTRRKAPVTATRGRAHTAAARAH
jgi:hemerythrin-like domain-containing protein